MKKKIDGKDAWCFHVCVWRGHGMVEREGDTGIVKKTKQFADLPFFLTKWEGVGYIIEMDVKNTFFSFCLREGWTRAHTLSLLFEDPIKMLACWKVDKS